MHKMWFSGTIFCETFDSCIWFKMQINLNLFNPNTFSEIFTLKLPFYFHSIILYTPVSKSLVCVDTSWPLQSWATLCILFLFFVLPGRHLNKDWTMHLLNAGIEPGTCVMLARLRFYLLKPTTDTSRCQCLFRHVWDHTLSYLINSITPSGWISDKHVGLPCGRLWVYVPAGSH